MPADNACLLALLKLVGRSAMRLLQAILFSAPANLNKWNWNILFSHRQMTNSGKIILNIGLAKSANGWLALELQMPSCIYTSIPRKSVRIIPSAQLIWNLNILLVRTNYMAWHIVLILI